MFGGKSRWIDTVFARIGKVGVWSEPCMGTAVMTLNNPTPAPREVICDLNAFVANFYRAVRGDYEQTAYHADWPTNHHDLTARHRWLLAQGPELSERMVSDPDDYDAKIAGWWVWGQSSWIGHGWCQLNHSEGYERQPDLSGTGGGAGVSQQRVNVPVEDKRPKVPDGGDVPDQIPSISSGKFGNRGQGVQQQRNNLPHVKDKIPSVKNAGAMGVQQQRDQLPRCTDRPGGQGVSAQRVAVGEKMPRISDDGRGGIGVQMQRAQLEGDGTLDGSRLRPWFRAIAERLARAIILNRSWESALTDSVLQQTPSSPKPEVGVFLDPPYRTQRKDGGKRSTGLYQGDTDASSDAVAKVTYEWAVNGTNKQGERYADIYRVAYCMHEGDFPIPPGWTAETMGFSGHRDAAKKETAVDCVMFSPRCVPPAVDPQTEFGW